MKARDIGSRVKRRTTKAVSKVGRMYDTGKERMSQVEFRPMWERIKAGFGKTATIIGKGTGKAAESVARTAKRAGMQYERYGLQHKLQKLVTQLGAAVYDGRQKGAKSLSYEEPPIKDLVVKIKDLEQQLDALERRSRSLRKAA